MDRSARVVIINGPTAAGKSTAVKLLLERHGHSGAFAVLERDWFEDLAGRLLVEPNTEEAKRVHLAGLAAITAAAKAYLKQDISVVLAVAATPKTFARLERSFKSWHITHLCLLPSWAANRNRRKKRLGEDVKELEMFSWEEHRKFYDQLVARAEDGWFDDVIDTTRMRPAAVADRLAEYI